MGWYCGTRLAGLHVIGDRKERSLIKHRLSKIDKSKKKPLPTKHRSAPLRWLVLRRLSLPGLLLQLLFKEELLLTKLLLSQVSRKKRKKKDKMLGQN
jgi:hypothetical protein